jgi:hypothetical protein
MKRAFLLLAGSIVLAACSAVPRIMALEMGQSYVQGCPGGFDFSYVGINRSTSLNEAATLSLETLQGGIPTGISATFNPNPNLPEQGQSTITTQIGAVTPGRYSLRIKADAGGVVSYAPFDVLVKSSQVLTSFSNTAPRVQPGGSITVRANLERICYNAAVSLTATAPQGISVVVSPSNIPAGVNGANISITASPTLAEGEYSVAIVTSIPGLSDTAELKVTVAPPQP